MPVLVDGFDLDDHLVAKAQLAAGRVAAKTVLALPEDPVVAADGGHRDHALDEDLVELDEEPERGDAGDDAGEFVADFVAHEDDLLPLEHFALRLVRAAPAIARLRGV